MKKDIIIHMKSYTFRVIIEPDEPGYHGYVPALRGCHTCGDTVEQTKANLRDAIRLYVEDMIENGEEVPVDQGLESFETIQIDPSYA